MISLIVSTRKPELLHQFTRNVAQTIGVAHEIIPVVNDKGQYGLCEAYNIGAQQSQYPYLCFVHEDVLFHTPDWGAILIRILKDQQIGLVGVAGGMYKPANVSGWWDISDDLMRKHILQHDAQHQIVQSTMNPFEEKMADVATLDGVFLCTRREIWEEFKFDQQNFTGFHFYDIDFCTQVLAKCRIVVTYEILLEHFSQGNANSQEWIENALIYHTKWQNILPLRVKHYSRRKELISEKVACLKMINRARIAKFPVKSLIKYVISYVKQPYKAFFLLLYGLKPLKDTINKSFISKKICAKN